MKRKMNLSQMVREEFGTDVILTTAELYEIINEKIDFDISKRDLQHRIRSRLNTMMNAGSIIRIAPKTYKKIT